MNEDSFQVIQDDISKATEIAIITVDYKGKPVTKHSRCSNFCKNIRKYTNYNELCEKCDSRGGLEAVRLQKPYIYVCHAGLVDIAIPIIVDGQYLGAVMAGQVLIEEDDKEKLEQIVNNKNSDMDLIMKKEMSEEFKLLPTMTLGKVKSISRMIFHISSYIVKEALLKIKLNELNEKYSTISKMETLNKASGNCNNITLNQGNRFEVLDGADYADYADCDKDKLDEEIEVIKEDENLYKGNIILRPALEYIQNNCSKNITLNKMASICNISASYFSKLFKREIKENFSNYVNKVRIKKAKELLQNSDTPVINISIDLGFEDCGYFIKVFKNIERVTPAAYRKRLNSRN